MNRVATEGAKGDSGMNWLTNKWYDVLGRLTNTTAGSAAGGINKSER